MPSPPEPNPSAVTTLSLKPGDKVDSFTVVETIATTGSAVVYKAHDELLDRHVAIKQIILGDGDTAVALRKRIHDEAAIHKRVSATQPKHLIQFIDAVDDERGLMLVSEYYPSTSLEDLLANRPDALDERQALGIVAATAKGLNAIHDAGVVHRDLKPSNVLLGEDGGLKICDFGLSALIESQDSLSLGSVRYMAPELLKSEPADQRADIYSLGIMAYEMLAGRSNFDNAFRNVLRDQRNQAMRWMKWHTNARLSAPVLDELMPDLPQHLVQLVSRMMDKDQARRVGSAGDVLDAIRRHFVGDGPEEPLRNGRAHQTAGPATSTPGDTAPLPSRNKLPLILAGLLIFWIAVGLSLYVINESKKSAAQDRAIAEANSLIDTGNRDYTSGEFEAALENYQLVLNAWTDQTAMGQKAQLGVFKTRGRLAFVAEDYDSAIDYFSRYRDAGGSAAGIEDTIRDARAAKAFAQLTTSVQNHIAAEEFREAQQVVKDARQTQLTTDETNALGELDILIEERRAEVLAATRIAEARALVTRGDVPAAIATLEDLITLPPEGQKLLAQLRSERDYAEAIALGEESIRTGKLGEALDAFRAALAVRPDDTALKSRIARLDARKLTQEGAILFERKQFDAATQRFAEALLLDPENAEAKRLAQQIAAATQLSGIERAGDTAAAAGNFAVAITEFEKALEVDPENQPIRTKLNNVRVRYNLQRARQSIDRRDFESARALLDTALLLAPNDATVQEMVKLLDTQERYRTLIAQGDAARIGRDFTKAKRAYREAGKLVPGDDVDQRIEDADFEQFLDEARKNLADGELEAASAFIELARKIRTNQALVKLFDEIEAAGKARKEEDTP